MEQHALSKKFNATSLISYALPTIIMFIFISTYTTADGVFVSNFVCEDALSAINIVLPFICFSLALSLMLSAGSNAIIAKLLGEKKEEEARSFFSLIFIVGGVIGIVLAVISFAFTDELLHFLGATKALYPYAKNYLDILIIFSPFFLIKVLSENFFITIGKPNLGLALSIIGGVINIVLDYIFISPLNMGIAGAALASSIGYSTTGIFSIIYFSVKRDCILRLEKPKWDSKKLLQSCFNGSSEFINHFAVSIVTLLFNMAMIKYAGENGVAAITIILYLQMVLSSIYTGYSVGVSPVISYKYGEKDKAQLNSIMKISFVFIGVISAIVFILSFFCSDIGIGIFVKKGTEVFKIAKHGYRIFAYSFMFMGFNIIICAIFTAFSNGKISALLSTMRTLVFLCIGIQVLPIYFGLTGVWITLPIAEALSFILSIIFYIRYRKTYLR